MKVHDQLEFADLQNLAAAPASPTVGRIYFDTVLSKFRYWDGSAWHNLVLEDSGLFTAPATLAQVSSPAAPSSGYQKIYPKSDGFLYTMDPSGAEKKIGSGAGSINYLSANPDAESGTAGYATYADLAGALPVDGTGGAPSHITISASAVSPLRGTKSLLISNSGGSSARGEGVSFDFTIDRADRAKVLSINFDYEIASGTYLDGDLTVYIYDVTNAQVIQPAGYQILSAVSGLSVKQVSTTFQTASNSTSYRLIFHVASTSTSAYSVKLDNLVVGPQIITQGTPVTDPVAYTPVFSGFGTVASSFMYWQRVGNMLHVHGVFTTGVQAATTGSISLPGVSIDTTKLGNQVNNSGQSGDIVGWYGAQGNVDGNIVTAPGSSATSVYLSGSRGAGSGSASTPFATMSTLITNGTNVNVDFWVPIAGWSSQVQMSSDTSTRVVAFQGHQTASQLFGSGTTNFVGIDTVDLDTHGAFNTSTFAYTVQVPGKYRVNVIVNATRDVGGQFLSTGAVTLYKNGAPYRQIEGATYGASAILNISLGGSVILDLVAGDTLQIAINWTTTGGGAVDVGSPSLFSVERIAGPSQIAKSEVIRAKASSVGGGQSGISSGASTLITSVFAAKAFDTHNALTVGGGVNRFVAPRPDYYTVSAAIRFSTGGAFWASGNQLNMWILKNGTTVVGALGHKQAEAATQDDITIGGTDTVYLLAGEYIELKMFTNGPTLNTGNADDSTTTWMISAG